MLGRFVTSLMMVAAIAAGCSRAPAAPANFGITPPASWGAVVEDKRDDWSGEMAGSTKDVIESFVGQYQGWSKTTVVEEQTANRAVLKFDNADLVKGMAKVAGVNPGSVGAKPLNRRLLIEVVPDGKNFAVRSRTFEIAN